MVRYLHVEIMALGILGFAGHFAIVQESVKTDWPLFGGTPARNMVNLTDRNIATDWSIDNTKRKNIKWSAELGTFAFGGPVVAGGRVFVGTNNDHPRDPQMKKSEKGGNNCVLMCFRESDGKFLWQTVHDVHEDDGFVRRNGLMSTPTVVGGHVFYVLPDAVVVCADVANGKIVWQFDMSKELKVVPYHGFCYCETNNRSPLVVGDLVYLVTGNGIDDETGKLSQPQAPSFVALNKNSGRLVWQSNLPGDKVIEGHWSNPAYAVIKGKPQVIFAGGDATIYSFEPLTGKLIWWFRCHPQWVRKDRGPSESYFVATPVIHDDKVYVGLGAMIPNPNMPRYAHFLCIDATRTGDVSPGDWLHPNPSNKNSALLWSFGGKHQPLGNRDRRPIFGPTVSTCAIHDGLVYIPEERGYMYCLDARSGYRYWEYDFRAGIHGSPLYVDGKIYVATEDGEMVIFQAGRQLKVLNTIDMDEVMHRTPVVANGVLYVATNSKLYAIAGK